MMEIERAKTIVQQFFKNAQDPAMEDLLESSKGSDYRPYFVAAFFIYSDYQQLVKADEVTFAYDKLFSIKGLLNMQRNSDCNLTDIPECYTVDHLLSTIDGGAGLTTSSDDSGMSFTVFGM